MWQAEHVAALLQRIEPSLDVEMVSTDTFGDRRLDLSIPELGGKGVFSKEIQQLVMAGEADLAVHSAKDLQAVTPEDLVIAAFPQRGDPRDALVGSTLEDLPHGGRVATGSNRRGALLLEHRPDIELHPLRGNIATRLAKVREFDAIVMAAVALERLAVAPPVVQRLEVSQMIPQVGQGCLAVEVRRDAPDMFELVSRIDHADTAQAVNVERSFLAELGGDCNLPAGAHATLVDGSPGQVRIDGMLAAGDLRRVEHGFEIGPVTADPGRVLARRLRKQLEAGQASAES